MAEPQQWVDHLVTQQYSPMEITFSDRENEQALHLWRCLVNEPRNCCPAILPNQETEASIGMNQASSEVGPGVDSLNFSEMNFVPWMDIVTSHLLNYPDEAVSNSSSVTGSTSATLEQGNETSVHVGTDQDEDIDTDELIQTMEHVD